MIIGYIFACVKVSMSHCCKLAIHQFLQQFPLYSVAKLADVFNIYPSVVYQSKNISFFITMVATMLYEIYPTNTFTDVQDQKVVISYFQSEQLLPLFGFLENNK